MREIIQSIENNLPVRYLYSTANEDGPEYVRKLMKLKSINFSVLCG
jgi:hypothetical protein